MVVDVQQGDEEGIAQMAGVQPWNEYQQMLKSRKRTELRDKGYHFFTDGDSEVIIKAYREWGEDAPKHLHGMFAFVIWDRRKRCCFMARDRFGIKPLYSSLHDRRMRLASNTQALLAAVPKFSQEGQLKSIDGNVPNLVTPPPGCRFHPRCPYATEICRTDVPEFKEHDDMHYAACWHPGGEA